MNIDEQIIPFIRNIETIAHGYKSWGKVSLQKIAVQDVYFLNAIDCRGDINTLTELDIKFLGNTDEDNLIAAIFKKRKNIKYIIITRQEYASTLNEEVPPILDDQAQLLGVSIKIADVSNTETAIKNVVAALKNRYAAVCNDGRCICLGNTIDDAYIAAQLLEKTGKAWLEAKYLGGAKSINRFEAWAMQMYYQYKYAKEAKKNK